MQNVVRNNDSDIWTDGQSRVLVAMVVDVGKTWSSFLGEDVFYIPCFISVPACTKEAREYKIDRTLSRDD